MTAAASRVPSEFARALRSNDVNKALALLNAADGSEGAPTVDMEEQFMYMRRIKDSIEEERCTGTPLLWAACHDNTALALALLQRGADADTADNQERTAMHWAALCNNVELMEALGKHGAYFNRVSKLGTSPLGAASVMNHLKLVQALVTIQRERHVDIGLDTQAMDTGQTALMAAADHGHYEVVAMLLDAGANPDFFDRHDQTTALMLAALDARIGPVEQHEDKLKEFASRNANRTLALYELLKPRSVGSGPAKHADANLQDAKGITALHCAVGRDRPDVKVVAALAEAMDTVDVEDHEGRTPLMEAIEDVETDVVLELLKPHGTTPRARLDHQSEPEELPPLLWALCNRFDHKKGRRRDRLAIIKAMVEVADADEINCTDNSQGQVALLRMAERLDIDLVELLLTNPHILVDKTDNSGWTPLQWALNEATDRDGGKLDRQKDIVRMLVDHGANLKYRPQGGQTAAEWAESSPDRSLIAEFLRGLEGKKPGRGKAAGGKGKAGGKGGAAVAGHRGLAAHAAEDVTSVVESIRSGSTGQRSSLPGRGAKAGKAGPGRPRGRQSVFGAAGAGAAGAGTTPPQGGISPHGRGRNQGTPQVPQARRVKDPLVVSSQLAALKHVLGLAVGPSSSGAAQAQTHTQAGSSSSSPGQRSAEPLPPILDVGGVRVAVLHSEDFQRHGAANMDDDDDEDGVDAASEVDVDETSRRLPPIEQQLAQLAATPGSGVTCFNLPSVSHDDRPARGAPITAVHPLSYLVDLAPWLARLSQLESASTFTNGETVCSEGTAEALKASVIAARVAVETVMTLQPGTTHAVVVGRPPGHHAGAFASINSQIRHGFCLINNAVNVQLMLVLVDYILQLQKLAESAGAAGASSSSSGPAAMPAVLKPCRVLIHDFDTHHSNGTVEVFTSIAHQLKLTGHTLWRGGPFIDLTRDVTGRNGEQPSSVLIERHLHEQYDEDYSAFSVDNRNAQLYYHCGEAPDVRTQDALLGINIARVTKSTPVYRSTLAQAQRSQWTPVELVPTVSGSAGAAVVSDQEGTEPASGLPAQLLAIPGGSGLACQPTAAPGTARGTAPSDPPLKQADSGCMPGLSFPELVQSLWPTLWRQFAGPGAGPAPPAPEVPLQLMVISQSQAALGLNSFVPNFGSHPMHANGAQYGELHLTIYADGQAGSGHAGSRQGASGHEPSGDTEGSGGTGATGAGATASEHVPVLSTLRPLHRYWYVPDDRGAEAWGSASASATAAFDPCGGAVTGYDAASGAAAGSGDAYASTASPHVTDAPLLPVELCTPPERGHFLVMLSIPEYIDTSGDKPDQPGTARVPLESWMRHFNSTVLPCTEAFAPHAIVGSAGFDGDETDHVGRQSLRPGVYRMIPQALSYAASMRQGGVRPRMVSVLEGGYGNKVQQATETDGAGAGAGAGASGSGTGAGAGAGEPGTADRPTRSVRIAGAGAGGGADPSKPRVDYSRLAQCVRAYVEGLDAAAAAGTLAAATAAANASLSSGSGAGAASVVSDQNGGQHGSELLDGHQLSSLVSIALRHAAGAVEAKARTVKTWTMPTSAQLGLVAGYKPGRPAKATADGTAGAGGGNRGRGRPAKATQASAPAEEGAAAPRWPSLRPSRLGLSPLGSSSAPPGTCFTGPGSASARARSTPRTNDIDEDDVMIIDDDDDEDADGDGDDGQGGGDDDEGEQGAGGPQPGSSRSAGAASSGMAGVPGLSGLGAGAGASAAPSARTGLSTTALGSGRSGPALSSGRASSVRAGSVKSSVKSVSIRVGPDHDSAKEQRDNMATGSASNSAATGAAGAGGGFKRSRADMEGPSSGIANDRAQSSRSANAAAATSARGGLSSSGSGRAAISAGVSVQEDSEADEADDDSGDVDGDEDGSSYQFADAGSVLQRMYTSRKASSASRSVASGHGTVSSAGLKAASSASGGASGAGRGGAALARSAAAAAGSSETAAAGAGNSDVAFPGPSSMLSPASKGLVPRTAASMALSQGSSGLVAGHGAGAGQGGGQKGQGLAGASAAYDGDEPAAKRAKTDEAGPAAGVDTTAGGAGLAKSAGAHADDLPGCTAAAQHILSLRALRAAIDAVEARLTAVVPPAVLEAAVAAASCSTGAAAGAGAAASSSAGAAVQVTAGPVTQLDDATVTSALDAVRRCDEVTARVSEELR